MKIPAVQRPSKEVLQKIHSLKHKKGMIAAIEPRTGEYFLGKTLVEALKKGRKQFPDAIFYSVRIGYPSAHRHRGGIRRV